MKRALLLTVLLGAGCGMNATDVQPNEKVSFISQAVSFVTSSWAGYAAVAGIGIYAAYALVKHIMYQEEERVLHDQYQELEVIEVSKKDFGLICQFIDAMEQDIEADAENPRNINRLALTEFDNEEMADCCDSMRNFFCSIYDQCDRPVLEEIVMIFKQMIHEKTIIV
jgi:hypothetical protein